MHPELKEAARDFLRAHRSYHDNRAVHWPRPHNDMPQYIAMLDAMCNLCTAARVHIPLVHQNDRFHRHIARLARRQRFEPYPRKQWGYDIVAPRTTPYTSMLSQ